MVYNFFLTTEISRVTIQMYFGYGIQYTIISKPVNLIQTLLQENL